MFSELTHFVLKLKSMAGPGFEFEVRGEASCRLIGGTGQSIRNLLVSRRVFFLVKTEVFKTRLL